MARINIEDSLFKERSFEKLMFKLGSRRAAIGAIVEVFMLAQKHYLSEANDRLIPIDDWKREEISDEIIECGFAEIRTKGIYVRGSKEQFSWLIQRQEAGRKGGLAKSNKKNLSLATDSDRLPDVSDSKPLTLSPTLTPTLTLTLTHSQKEKKAPSNKLHEANAPLPDELILSHDYLIERKAKPSLVKEWLSIFPEPDWIIGELKKAHLWELANPRKKKKDFGKFMTNWLNRGWDTRKIQSSQFNKTTQRTENNRAVAEAYMKKLEAENEV